MDRISYASFDPGLKGGIAIFEVGMKEGSITSFALVDSLRMPHLPSPRYKTKKSMRIDVRELHSILVSYNVTHGCIELVSAMPAMDKFGKVNQGAASTFAFGYGTGMLEGVLFLHNVELTWVTPSVWKKHLGLIKATKRDSIDKAHGFWPDFEFTRMCDEGRAEAALIGMYGITKLLRG